jgi:ComF family protein
MVVPPPGTTRWRAVVRVLRSPVDALACAFFPTSCSLCGSLLPQISSVPICAACWAEFSASSDVVCARCGDLLDVPSANSPGQLCRTCRLAPPPFARAVAFAPYQGRMRSAIHALKYGRLHPSASRLGWYLAQAIGQLASEAPEEMLVVPVPLHRTKQAQRGFNQARALAVVAVKELAKTHPAWRLTVASSALMRLRATKAQAGLTTRQRRLNVRGVFSVMDSKAIQQKHVLLVDDIFTTGATVRAASRALLRAGAASVWVATLARARRTGDNTDEFETTRQDVDRDAVDLEVARQT